MHPTRKTHSGVARFLRRLWRGIREWCGDAAYERYLSTQVKNGRDAALLSREQFYLEELQKRYSRVSRCC